MPVYLPPESIPANTEDKVAVVCVRAIAHSNSHNRNSNYIAKAIKPHAVEIREQPVAAKSKLECTTSSLSADNIPLKSIKIDSNWKQTRRVSKWAFGGNSGYDYQFVTKSAKASAALSLYWDGRLIEPIHQAAWREMLTRQPHKLNNSEIEFLREAPHLDQADPKQVRLHSAKTVVWNGRTVVETEGETVDANEPVIRKHEIAFDNYGDYRSVGQISYSAKAADFPKFETAGLKMMNSIRWAK